MIRFVLLLSLSFLLFSCGATKSTEIQPSAFAKENLIPWSIVAFDSLDRSPEERVAMVKDLGFSQYAFGGRQRHIDKMTQEIEIARASGIKISAVWLYLNHKKDSVGKLKPMSEQVFASLEETGLKTQIWVGLHPDYFSGLSHGEALTKAVAMIGYIAKRAEAIGCAIALYNHGGWYGVPKNQIAIIDALPQHNIGVVYNFHHAHKDLATFSEDIKALAPYLKCVNLNGMKSEGPKILSIGKGDLEREMIAEILNLNYRGPWGILGHVKGGNPERILQENYQGLQILLSGF